MEAINLSRKFSLFRDYWRPKIVGELNDAYVKLVKVKGEFVWHHHEGEDELFLVVKGRLRIRLRDRTSPSPRKKHMSCSWSPSRRSTPATSRTSARSRTWNASERAPSRGAPAG